jgi:predicted permease
MVLRETARFVRRNRVLSISAVTVLAVGIGASTCAFSLLQAISGQEIAGISQGSYVTIAHRGGAGPLNPMAWASFNRLRGLTTDGNPVVAYAYNSLVVPKVQHAGQNENAGVAFVSAGFFKTLGIGIVSGRDMSLADENPNTERVVLISESLAVRWFGSAQQAVGKPLRIQGVECAIIGVVSSTFHGLVNGPVEIWASPPSVVPFYWPVPKLPSGAGNSAANAAFASAFSSPTFWEKIHLFYAVAGGRSSVGQRQLMASVSVLLQQMRSEDTTFTAVNGITSDPGYAARLLAWIKLTFLLTSALTLVAALNFGGLLLARAPQQVQEVRLKRTFGATTIALLMELIVGPLLLVMCGAICGTVLAVIGRKILPSLSIFSGSLSLFSSHLAVSTFLWEFVVAGCVALALGAVPALRLLRDSGTPHLSYTATKSEATIKALRLIIVSQITFAMTVSIFAAMICRTVILLSHQSLGFRTDNVLIAAIDQSRDSPQAVLITTSAQGTFPMANIAKAVLEMPSQFQGVEAVAVSGSVPLDRPLRSITLTLPEDTSREPRVAAYTVATPGYFDVLGIPYVAGRGFSSQQLTGIPTEVVINQALAKELWPGQDSLNRVLRIKSEEGWFDGRAIIVGVVADARFAGPKYSSQPTLYLPLQGNAFSVGLPMYVVARGHVSAKTVGDMVSADVGEQIPGLAVSKSYALSGRIDDALSDDWLRVRMALLGTSILLLISYTGLYGATTFFVNFRRRELAIRVCFGATPKTIMYLILRGALTTALIAATASMIFWLILSPLLRQYYFEAIVSSVTIAVAVLLLCVLSMLLVALKPALAAARLFPWAALRED